MSVIVELSIPASQFILGKALMEAPDLELEIERVIPTGSTTIPYFWVTGDDQEAFESVLANEPELSESEVVDEIDGRRLYRVEWASDVDTFIQQLTSHDVVLQEASGDHRSWAFQLRFPDSHELSEFHTACRENGMEVTIDRLYNPIEPTTTDSRNLTDAQRELILRAYDEGYFDVPRRITLEELGEKIDVSDQAVNERLRRGLSALISTTLQAGTSPE